MLPSAGEQAVRPYGRRRLGSRYGCCASFCHVLLATGEVATERGTVGQLAARTQDLARAELVQRNYTNRSMLFARLIPQATDGATHLASIDDLVAAITASIDAAERTKMAVQGSRDQTDEFLRGLELIGIEGKASSARTIKADLDEIHNSLSGLADILDQARARVETLRNSGSGASTASSGFTPAARVASSGPSISKPSHGPDPNRVPSGVPEALEGDARKLRGLQRQNEAASLLAKSGYEIQQSPPPRANGRRPDFVIEGDYFDCYAPTSDSPKNVRTGIRDKIKKQQADRIILDLNDSNLPPEALRDRLQRDPIHGLREIKIVKGDTVTDFYPWDEEH